MIRLDVNHKLVSIRQFLRGVVKKYYYSNELQLNKQNICEYTFSMILCHYAETLQTFQF